MEEIVTRGQEQRRKELLAEAKAELAEQRDRAQQAKGLDALIQQIICEGLELRYELLRLAHVKVGTQESFSFPSGREGRRLRTRWRIWLTKMRACDKKWRRDGPHDKLTPVELLYSHFAPGSQLDKSHRDSLVAHIDDLLDEIRPIVPTLQILSFDAAQAVRQELTGDELDHAEQLLQIEGPHEEAILRAAGVIAGVVLERHFSHLIDRLSPNLPEPDRYKRRKKADGLGNYTNWLIGQGVIPSAEKKPLDRLAFVRNCCDHAPSGDLRAPRREEVQDLIRDTRRYLDEIVLP